MISSLYNKVCHWYWNYTHPHDKRTNKALVISESMSVFISVDEAKFRKKKDCVEALRIR